MDLFEEIVRLRRSKTPAALATVVATKGSTPAKVPARMLVRTDGTFVGTVGGGCIENDILRAARDCIDTGKAKTFQFRLSGLEAERTGVACGGTVDIMVESLEEPWVVIIGAGHVGQAVARLAAETGFAVSIVDDRPDFASVARFPTAREHTVVDLERLGEAVNVSRRTQVLIMTRGHAEDFRVLLWALGTEAKRIGVLGSRSKRVQFLEELAARGFSQNDLARIRMPVGVDIGAETVDEIAISIVAQLIAGRRDAETQNG